MVVVDNQRVGEPNWKIFGLRSLCTYRMEWDGSCDKSEF